MNKQSFLNKNPIIASLIVLVYIFSIYKIIEISSLFIDNPDLFITYYFFITFIIFAYSNTIIKFLKHDS